VGFSPFWNKKSGGIGDDAPAAADEERKGGVLGAREGGGRENVGSGRQRTAGRGV